MKPFTYLTPHTLDEAVSLYESHEGRAAYIAGGTDVLIKIKEEKIEPDYLISLAHIPVSEGVRFNEDTRALHISAFTTHRTLELSPLIRRDYPILHDAVKNIGSVQIRNTATIGGNLANAVPSADGAIPLITMDAVAHIYGTKGERTVDLIHFFLGPGQTVLEKGEILTEIVVPPAPARTGSAYIKFGRRKAMELPLLGVGMLLSLDADMTTCVKVRIGLGVAAPTPIRAYNAERFLKGREVTDATLAEAGQIAADEARVRDSIRGVAWYRRELVGVLVKRMGALCRKRITDEKSIS
ncbi:MAG: xanthine dehydrogenase family protein subunit M [Deltaproteobacteria bacterium]|nr:MAG: xanthine dehydrogenase family protein subunit M [Deltaproteobacteria bacterium]